MSLLAADFRFAARRLARAPGWSAAVVATIAVTIAAVTALFAVVDAVLLRPLPFPDSERVAILCETAERTRGMCIASPPNVEDWARESRSFEQMGVARSWPFQLRREGQPSGARGGIATAGYFQVLRARPALGRLLEPRDLEPGNQRVVVLRYGFWQREFGASPTILGATLDIDDQPAMVIGVLAADTWIPELEWVDVWMPLTATIDDVSNRAWRGFTALGRLAPGASLDSAREELELIRARLAVAYPETNAGWGVQVERLRDRLVGSVRTTLLFLFAAAALLLLIACVNVALLLLARAGQREGELAVRAALGAERRRLARLVLVECLVLAGAGGLLAAPFAWGAIAALRALAPVDVPRLGEVALDLRVVAFAAVTTLSTTVVFGLAPALRASRSGLVSFLQRNARGSSTSGGRVRHSLVVAEVALSVLLLVGAALLARGFLLLAGWDPGFDISRLTPVWLSASPGKYRQGAQAVAAFERVVDEVAALPGVESAALASAGPLFGGTETSEILTEKGPQTAGEPPTVRWFDIGPGFFATLGVPIVRGRDFAASDTAGSPPVAIVNHALANRLWPGEEAVGHHVTVQDQRLEIVGVVADVPPLRPDLPVASEIYWPNRQAPRWGSYLLYRAAPGSAALEHSVRARIAAVDSDFSAGSFVPLAAQFSRRMVSPRFIVWLTGGFAAVALLLAAIGTYGVVAFSVNSRTREFGIRMALGAAPRQILRGVVRHGMTLVGCGMAFGLTSALAAARALRGMLYGVPPTDSIALAGAASLFAAVALLACTVPARRAGRIDPAVSLRTE